MNSTPVEFFEDPTHNTRSQVPALVQKSSKEIGGMAGIGESYPDPVDGWAAGHTPESVSFINRDLMFTDKEVSSTRWDNEADMMRALSVITMSI